MKWSRLCLLMLPLVAACFSKTKAQVTDNTLAFHEDGTFIYFNPALKPFYHGVASGDPLPDAAIIWTRVTPDFFKDSIPVKWEVALDTGFLKIEATGQTIAVAAHDFTVKIDAKGLRAGCHHYYRFEALGNTSPVGRTKTPALAHNPARFVSAAAMNKKNQSYPSPNNQIRLAVVSCNNYEAGYFNGFARIAEITDLDAVVHLGDYIYEYGAHEYGDTSIHDRSHLPPHEILTLQDYRTRFAQYRLDPDLQAAHQTHPFICVWDDHEIANNAYADGAENHQPNEGDYHHRQHVAIQAYFEWLPVREGISLYRQFSFGGLADVFMLDERVAGRSPQPPNTRSNNLKTDRSMLGETQLAWLEMGLRQSTATWKIIGNQVLFSELNLVPVASGLFKNLDAWDGYPTERQHLKDFLGSEAVPNVIFATGDTHASWSFEVPFDFKQFQKKKSGKIVAHEFATPSVTSANFDEYKGEKAVRFLEKMFASDGMNPHLRFLDLRHHGYLLLTLTPYDAVAEWRYMEDIRRRTDGEYVGEKQLLRAEKLPEMAEGEASTLGSSR